MFVARSRSGPAADGFSCQACGSASISVPATLHPDALVSCGRCGWFVATWSNFCEEVDHIVSGTSPRLGSVAEIGMSQQ